MRRRATIIADAHSTARLLFSSRRNTLALESITACLFVGSVSMALSPVGTAHSSLAQRSIQIGSAVMSSVYFSEWQITRSPAFRSRSGIILLPWFLSMKNWCCDSSSFHVSNCVFDLKFREPVIRSEEHTSELQS